MSATGHSTAPQPTASLEPLVVVLRSHLEGTSDFFPFDDVATLGTSPEDKFTFKDLIEEGIDGSQDITLFSTGCWIDGESNCPRACNDTSHFFGSLETFYNCAALASIAYWTSDAEAYFIPGEAEQNASSIMGSVTLADFDDRAVLSKFVTCAQHACAGDGLSVPCDQEIQALDGKTSTAKEIFDAMANFCPDIPAEINPDIFGPGVLISYILQTAFSSLLYVFLKAFTIWVQYFHSEEKVSGGSLRRIPTMIWRDSSALSRLSIAIATTLVEFQEAQAWFVFALQLASILAIVVNSQEGTFWGEIIANGAIAYHISQNGILPMFLVQICLHNEGIRNWHTFLGFFVEYLLAIVATTQKISFSSAFELFKSQSSIDACGGNPSPRTYCAASKGTDGIQLSFFPHPLLYKGVFLVLDSIAVLVLLIDQLAWTFRKHPRLRKIRVRGHRLGSWPKNHKLRPHWLKFSTWFWRFLEFAYLIVNILFMISLLKVINAESFAANKWSYGQIIAVTVWGPVIVKLGDIILSGPPKNGDRLNSGPPRLRIDNVLNKRNLRALTGMSDDSESQERADEGTRFRRTSVFQQRRKEVDAERGSTDDASKDDQNPLQQQPGVDSGRHITIDENVHPRRQASGNNEKAMT